VLSKAQHIRSCAHVRSRPPPHCDTDRRISQPCATSPGGARRR
jgi:hypothetical protein